MSMSMGMGDTSDRFDPEQEMDTPSIRSLAFAEFSAANRKRCQSPEGFGHAIDSWSLSDWFTATMGELGEAANLAKKLNRVRDGIPGNTETETELREKLRREIADVLIYLDLLAQSQGFALEDAVRETLDAKSEAIGYPARLGGVVPAPSPPPCDQCGQPTVRTGRHWRCFGCGNAVRAAETEGRPNEPCVSAGDLAVIDDEAV